MPQFGLDGVQLAVEFLQLFSQFTTTGDQRLLGVFTLGGGKLGGRGLLFSPQFVTAGDQLAATTPQGQDRVEVDLDTSVTAILSDVVEIVTDVL